MTDRAETEERLRTNYNDTGVAVLETIYSADFLSIGGIPATDELARAAGVTAGARVLDIGCGVGGPMLRLAETLGCPVTGIDLIETSVEEARRRTASRGLRGVAHFEVGDATRLDFPAGSFDVVWGQDSWCHVADKASLLGESFRVLVPGGTIAFTDWLEGTGMSGAERAAALDAAVSRDAVTAGDYRALLGEAGFVDVRHTDLSEAFIERYREVYRRLRTRKPELVERFGPRVYAIVADVNGTILRGFEGGAITGGRFVATRPA